MENRRPGNLSAFTHTWVRTETRLPIQSTCKYCGKSKIASHHDGTLEQWQDGHKCDTPKSQGEPSNATLGH